MNILGGIFLIALGIALIVFSGPLTEVVGRRSRADRNLGGTTQAFVLFGVGLIIIAMFVMFGQAKGLSTEVQTGLPVAN